MSMTEKAVEIMHKKASELPEYSETTRPDTYFKSGFKSGYHQAEKDLEIMWKDIELIVNIDLDTNHEEVITGSRKNEEHYQEVLKRFKDFKERKDGGKG